MTAIGTSVGMALGVGVVGLLLNHSDRADQYVFPVLATLFLCLGIAMLFLPETITHRSWSWSSLRPRVSIEPSARDTFWSTVPTSVAGWAATGLFLARVPSLVREVLHVDLAAVLGSTLMATGALTLLLQSSPQRRWSSQSARSSSA